MCALLITSEWIRLILGISVSFMEICLHVVLRQRAEQRLSEFDVLGHFVLEERMNVAKVSDLEPTRLFISTLNEPAPHARLIVQHDQL